nr:MAG TPA: hypothetical protein [Caudoviricetes sp.]
MTAQKSSSHAGFVMVAPAGPAPVSGFVLSFFFYFLLLFDYFLSSWSL